MQNSQDEATAAFLHIKLDGLIILKEFVEKKIFLRICTGYIYGLIAVSASSEEFYRSEFRHCSVT